MKELKPILITTVIALITVALYNYAKTNWTFASSLP